MACVQGACVYSYLHSNCSIFSRQHPVPGNHRTGWGKQVCRLWARSGALSSLQLGTRCSGAAGGCAQWTLRLSTAGLHTGWSWEGIWAEHLGEQMGWRNGCWRQ